MDLTFVLTRDEIYVPVAIRKPAGDGPFPVITMGRGDGKGGVPHLEAQVDLLASMQDEMIRRGYVVVYVNYRNEVPHLYENTARAENLPDDVSGGARRTVKSRRRSIPTTDCDFQISAHAALCESGRDRRHRRQPQRRDDPQGGGRDGFRRRCGHRGRFARIPERGHRAGGAAQGHRNPVSGHRSGAQERRQGERDGAHPPH